MQVYVDPIALATLTASIHAVAVGAMWISGICGLATAWSAIIAVIHAENGNDAASHIYAAVAVGLLLIGIDVFGTHYYDLKAPQYTALRQLTNQQVIGHILPE